MSIQSFSLIILLLAINSSFGQMHHRTCDSSLYLIPTQVQSEYNQQNYLKAAKAAGCFWERCSEENIKNELVYITVYNTACCWSLLNEKDSAFKQLNYVIKDDLFLPLFREMQSDDDFLNLHTDERWHDLIKKGDSLFGDFSKSIDSGLVRILEKIRYNDQKYRSEVVQLNQQKADESTIKKVWRNATIQDSVDMIKIEEIIEKYGWPGPRLVGFDGNKTVFLVVQHAPLKVQLKYLPVMKKAVQDNLASSGDLAFLVDRVRLRQKKKQLYGTQLNSDFSKAFPIQDSGTVDCRRFKVGLVTLDRYIHNW
ncbi:hypothetical protein SAMN05192529_108133 [Arachidicoccus rhizosphaerae]|uniref:Uncharacterized protein n=1 Tax=Arachidicoccus rhizosphaerae TaxID=551991 RepID=A0A1H3YK03_9BACT|nr:DUF6624 domain-containing protein [Arachidicoccus rhizosphaerae]SEA11896.1 hypothetical protein SAMN05192529_108133 [Arachidicoccus rhizosphaerae]